MLIAQVSIGDPVVVAPRRLHHPRAGRDRRRWSRSTRARDRPVRDVGLRAGDIRGATIERGVSIGTGAKVIGAGAHRRRRHDRRQRGRGGRRAGGRDRRRRTGAPVRAGYRCTVAAMFRLQARADGGRGAAERASTAARGAARRDRRASPRQPRRAGPRHRAPAPAAAPPAGIRLLEARRADPAHPGPASTGLPEADGAAGVHAAPT